VSLQDLVPTYLKSAVLYKTRSPAMQNPGDLVTIKPAIKSPGFQVFLFNRGSNCHWQALAYSAVANSALAAPRFRVRVLKSI
jgi:hypothetical protein